jgi:ABC-type transport system substrate-binding protein
MRKDYVVGLNLLGSEPDPDQNLYLLYGCGGDLNYNGHCNPEIDELIDQQSTEAIKRNADDWFGKSNGSWRRTVLARSSFSIAVPAAGSPI